MTTPEAPTALLDRVRALLAKAESTEFPGEAEAYTIKAAELMAKYGIDRARLGALHPESDKPADKIIGCPNPWGAVHMILLAMLARALRCQCIQLNAIADFDGARLHVFGYQSDIERLELLYTSLLLQLATALRVTGAPGGPRPPYVAGGKLKAWNRSFMLGFGSEVGARVQAAEDRAAGTAAQEDKPSSGRSTALVLADRSLVVKAAVKQVYPKTRAARVTYTGSGYGHGQAAGQRADIGTTRLGGAKALR
jgi:hypothetical protein